MNKQMNPRLFVRVLKLNAKARVDLLEFLGTTRIDEDELERLISDLQNGADIETAAGGLRTS
ncbi:hypothetical protein SAMN04488526_3102 [Jannaschia helgolandensis]|jgi:hypothetical protein|uniref:Uncharacterized protein n=2 Tax=Jannaschia helgolandensis TaxID=188906 RepID=A0A1H7RRJ1_9RHOB|nr:hypothetical protein SAMN04488526_3102 [Jannaschia helgolandensis]